MYHSVSAVPAGPLRPLAVPPALLREQLVALAESGYRLVGLSEAIDLRAAGSTENVVALTFDDGYLDFLTHGVQVLADVGATATLYMAVGHAGTPASWLGPRAGEFGPVMTWDQLREVAATGVEIGNHSFLHHPLDVLPPDQLDREVAESRDRLAQEVGQPVRSFAYPHGYQAARVRDVVARTGHDNACVVGRRLWRPADNEAHQGCADLIVREAGFALSLHDEAAAEHVVPAIPQRPPPIDFSLDMPPQRGGDFVHLGPQRRIVPGICELELEQPGGPDAQVAV